MNKNLEEISDGKRYGLNDMVRAACNDCAGCSSCCEDMGESIILDPLDIYELTKNLNTTFENLLKEQIELHVADGMDYFLQVEGCVKENRSKVKVCKWLDTPELKKNQQYLIDWHAFRKKIECILGDMSDENQKKTITMFLLNTFYINPYDTEQDFYPQFYARLDRIAQGIA